MKLLAFVLVLTAALAEPRLPLTVLVVQHSKVDRTFSAGTCRGTALDGHRILTVASCVDGWSEDVDVLIGISACKAPDHPVDHVVLHPLYDPALKMGSPSNVAILYLNESLQIDGNFQAPNIPRTNKTSGTAFLDTTPGWQQVPILQETPCRRQEPLNLLVPSTCNITLGSALLQSTSVTTLIGMVTSLPAECPSRCPLELTALGPYSRWATGHPKLGPRPPSSRKASAQLPEVPASVIFSFLKLLAVIGSLGGVSFVFCCVMFLISS